MSLGASSSSEDFDESSDSERPLFGAGFRSGLLSLRRSLLRPRRSFRLSSFRSSFRSSLPRFFSSQLSVVLTPRPCQERLGAAVAL